ncbi:hypothetical protein C7U92_24015 [Bradyrhizobium sp. WBOS7]|uniref:Uncharacterized protein n=1 Tax=Bradyrhizobium betae TaxID=244734 RepID=A0AAE9N9K8_9BRAD|nr:hypothetical protein [Bradyrhizobium sp. WBOS2]MDD1573914.1 hypothetical protein [Bradyrhizobium sp. WBOS1]MDD1579767.1 hypothetical protein [Bradyrhizobium sp. WBOS7]MDD1602958.1 hypothetical protein [Bradyrhizobium sp. WBOS16]UUO34300.1 hypothetical protein DCK84_06740 [Bradyrhizobium sp. WBOS01]UUO40731.1 hypothetical protein DCM75_08165 [Bradyrhizobium sp. WBOS02]UUO52829.1 hypothetical protein DCM79_07435 [Bradyrhizobium sp. WBOS07]UUO65000.1 hypothetical protein DCM83_07060 [Bradyrh
MRPSGTAHSAVVPDERSEDPGPISTGRCRDASRQLRVPVTTSACGYGSRIGARLRRACPGRHRVCGARCAYSLTSSAGSRFPWR